MPSIFCIPKFLLIQVRHSLRFVAVVIQFLIQFILSLSRVLRSRTYRAEPTHDRSYVALIALLVEHCTGNAKAVGSNPDQSLKIFSGHFSSSVWLHSHLSFFQYEFLIKTKSNSRLPAQNVLSDRLKIDYVHEKSKF